MNFSDFYKAEYKYLLYINQNRNFKSIYFLAGTKNL